MLLSQDKAFLDEVEASLAEHGFAEHGIPIGAGVFDITTNSESLDILLYCIRESWEHLSKGGTAEGMQTEEMRQKFLDFLQGLDNKDDSPEWQIVNTWISARKFRGHLKREIIIWKHRDTGAYRHEIKPFGEVSARAQLLMTSGFIRSHCNIIETEQIARDRLLEELSEEQKAQYLLTDGFAEKGKSGTLYILRRNRPTLAFSMNGESYDRVGNVLCALCMHPLAYYTGSWAGVMPPSDEILSHLFHIRTDEHRYWKICEQHNPSHYLSGL